MEQIDQLFDQLHDRTAVMPDLQFKAAIALGKVGDAGHLPRISAELVKALGGGYQALTRAHAAEALGLLGEAAAVPALIEALKDDYQLVRSYAARSLGKLGDPKAIQPLIEVLGKDRFFGARAEAAEALGVLCQGPRTPDAETEITKAAGKEALERYREEEKKRLQARQEEGRSQRVLNEINASLGKVGKLITDARQALLEGKDTLAAALLKKAQREANRMGALTRMDN